MRHIHAKGDVPGVVVRLMDAERVQTDRKTLQCGSTAEEMLRTRYRLALYDFGHRLSEAKSVNDLLMAIYDTLEVHRTLLTKRKVLHRDMSFFNILMYPRPVFEDAPPLIQDVLGGENRPLEKRTATSLMIDADNSALLRLDREKDVDSTDEELVHRTGTPMYIARSVALGLVLDRKYDFYGWPMPILDGAALDLYVKAHGQERYERYNDKDGTFHGGRPPTNSYNMKCPAFRHRPEHDVESVFWTLFTALLRAQPKGIPLEQWAPDAVDNVWNILCHHTIPENGSATEAENRHGIFGWSLREWQSVFSPIMDDIAILMYRIAEQIACEYALWDGQDAMHVDHLHEAVQRLILQYLVDHRYRPIPLDP
ncbi:hypothetical protein C8Q74DRAFT_1330518, partial [Fomes fomentarius]